MGSGGVQKQQNINLFQRVGERREYWLWVGQQRRTGDRPRLAMYRQPRPGLALSNTSLSISHFILLLWFFPFQKRPLENDFSTLFYPLLSFFQNIQNQSEMGFNFKVYIGLKLLQLFHFRLICTYKIL